MTQSWDFGGGPPRLGEAGSLTLVDGSVFWVSPGSGDLSGDGPHGLFAADMRSLSRYQLRINGATPEPLSALHTGPREVTLVGRVPPPPGRADSTVLVVRRRRLDGGLHDQVELRNLGLEAVACTVTLLVDADFADLFTVKENKPVDTSGRVTQLASPQAGTVHFGYRWLGITRDTRVQCDDLLVAGPGVLSAALVVPARSTLTTSIHVEVAEVRPPDARPARATGVRVRTPWWPLSDAVRTGASDLAVLQLRDPQAPDRRTVAAGAPWFMTVFGRDSLLTSLMALPFDLDMAVGTLHLLARNQGAQDDPLTEEEPGRVLHELRFGPEAQSALGGKNAYFGSVDATPLLVVLLEKAFRWGMEWDEVRELLSAADAALGWVSARSARDGFVAYERATDRGLLNQGWKDSFDGISTASGEPAVPPIALCEVQGYVYAALRARARLADHAGDEPTAQRLRGEADDLKARFNARFATPAGGIAVAVDRGGRLVDSVTSNQGHCLWSGIVEDGLASGVVGQLTGAPMSTGWGVRTLSADMAAFNPVSYHNGSVWPHDNAILVAGLRRYGAVDAAQRIALDVLAAAVHTAGRLPELWSGFDRSEFAAPVPYPTSCSPQAWAAAAPLQLLSTLLGLEADAPRGRLVLSPALPDELLPMTLEGVHVAGRELTIRVTEAGVGVTGLDGLTLVTDAPLMAPD